jgi:hypothetical protein
VSSFADDYFRNAHKPPRRDASGRVIQDGEGSQLGDARRRRRDEELVRMRLTLRRAERDRGQELDRRNDALLEEQRARREMREHARKLAREIEYEREERERRLGLNPYVMPWDSDYVSPTEGRIRRSFGVD